MTEFTHSKKTDLKYDNKTTAGLARENFERAMVKFAKPVELKPIYPVLLVSLEDYRTKKKLGLITEDDA